jgi:hypothetical protein
MEVFDVSHFVQRRQKLAAAARLANNSVERGVVVVCASFEEERRRFRQNSYFYYLFGITEPGAVGVISFDGTAVLYLPDFGGMRSVWVDEQVSFSSDASIFGLAQIKPLGTVQRGYSSMATFTADAYKYLIDDLSVECKTHGVVAGVWSDAAGEIAVSNLMQFLRKHCLAEKEFLNCTGIVDALRRIKNEKLS